MKTKLILLLLIFSVKIFSQNKSENVIYIIDNIKVINDPERGNEINNDDIADVNVIKNKDSLKKKGLENFDGAIFIFTKEFRKRSDELKKIPTTKNMEIRNGNIWYYNDKIYSGKFIDYYYSGRIQGEGTLLNGKLDGVRKMYFQNGKVAVERIYKNSIPNGLEQEFYEDGSLKQKGEFKNGKEEGIWEMYFPNGQLKQHTVFSEDKKSDESFAYFSNGKLFEHNVMIDGEIIKDKSLEEVKKLLNKSNEEYKNGNQKSSIKLLDKAIALNPNYKDAYFSRGTMLLNQMKYDDAIKDFDKAIEIEPYYDYAIANRAFARIRKYELGERELLKNSEVAVLASKKDIVIPDSEKEKICNDLNHAIFLGDKNEMIYDAIDKYCNNK